MNYLIKIRIIRLIVFNVLKLLLKSLINVLFEAWKHISWKGYFMKSFILDATDYIFEIILEHKICFATLDPPSIPKVHCRCASYPNGTFCSWPQPAVSSPTHYIATYRYMKMFVTWQATFFNPDFSFLFLWLFLFNRERHRQSSTKICNITSSGSSTPSPDSEQVPASLLLQGHKTRSFPQSAQAKWNKHFSKTNNI